MDTRSQAEQFVSKFVDFWRYPSPQRLPELLHSDVVLVQPLAPRTVGVKAAQAQFRRFLYSLPGLTADVDHLARRRRYRLHRVPAARNHRA